MRINLTLTAFFFVCCSAFGQTRKQQQQYELADSLGENFRFSEAQTIVNTLLQELSTKKTQDVPFRAELMRFKGYLYEQNNENSKAIKMTFKALDLAEKNKLYKTQAKAYITLALIHEKANDLSMCKTYLASAKKLLNEHKLDDIYPLYCVRNSSYLRFVGQKDSAIYYAQEALKAAHKYDQFLQISDANMLLGGLLKDSLPYRAVKHYEEVAHRFLYRSKYLDAGWMFNSISRIYLKNDSVEKAFVYNDSAFWAARIANLPIPSKFFEHSVDLFERTGSKDSALFYMRLMHNAYVDEVGDQQRIDIKRVSEEYAAKKKDVIIQNQKKVNRKQQEKVRLLTVSIISGIVVLLILIFGFTQIRRKNKSIKLKTDQLANSLEEQEVLLSELQHRVKNNLQIIIGILEFQTENSEHKSIEEITTETINRVRSMSILHGKLIQSDNLSHINIGQYFEEIIDLIQESNKKEGQHIEVNSRIELEEEVIDKSIPLGLILVELLSNSFKHAFGANPSGKISVSLELADLEGYKCKLTYKDNGKGIDSVEESKTGMGMEIIHGLTSQLKGKIIVENDNGFSAKLYY